MQYGKTTFTVEEATRKLEHYCAYQERSHQEVVQKLRIMGMIPVAIDTIVTHLITHNYLNEERFTKAFVSGKLNIKKWGRIRIVRELKIKGISDYNIKIALKDIDNDSYYEIFNDLSDKKFYSLKETNLLKKRKKLIDYLRYRGWESDMIFEKINELFSE